MKRPRVSIVIPTRNRADLLIGATGSALRQTWDDYELIVSDNCSDDGTAEAAGRFHDDRVRYVRTSEPLLMHGSWHHALGRARGEYITFLCDDDALHPRALALAEEAIRRTGADVVAWRSCSFCLPSWPDEAERGRVRFGPPYADRMFELDGRRIIDLAYELRLTFTDLVPKMLNCIVGRGVIERAAQDGAKLFHASSPDYSAMLVLALYARRMVLLDLPLVVAGATDRSIGASTLNDYEMARQYHCRLRDGEGDLILPPVVGPRITWLAQTFMQCAARVPALGGRDVNFAHLYGLAGIELEEARRAGIEAGDIVQAYKRSLREDLAAYAAAVHAFVEERRSIESETFIKMPAVSSSVMGRGGFVARDVSAEKTGWAEIGDVAAGLEEWLRTQSTPLEDVWKQVLRCAGDRTIILYGLGGNGRALLRALPESERGLLLHDDYVDDTYESCRRLDDAANLDARAHYVFITPDEADAITHRLEARGFAAGRDMATLHSLCESARIGAASDDVQSEEAVRITWPPAARPM